MRVVRHFFHHPTADFIGDYCVEVFFSVCEARPDIRIRVRGIVIRVHVGDTAVRIRIVVRAVDHAGASACLYLYCFLRDVRGDAPDHAFSILR
jgi:hypothetical protein